MGSAATPAGGTSLASAGLSAYGDLLKGEGQSEAYAYQAEKSDVAATYGQLKAVQTGGQMSRSLNTTLGNIEAVRAAARADPNSPTGAAVIDEQEQIGKTQRETTVNSILQQARQDQADAAYYRDASSRAMTIGEISVGGDILKAVTPLFGMG